MARPRQSVAGLCNALGLYRLCATAHHLVRGPPRGNPLVSAPCAWGVELGRGDAGSTAFCPAVLPAPVTPDHASGAVPHHGRCGALRAPSGGCLLARDASLLSWATACALARSRGSDCCGRTVAGGVSLATAATLTPALARAAPAGGHAVWLRGAVVARLHTTDTKPRMSTSA